MITLFARWASDQLANGYSAGLSGLTSTPPLSVSVVPQVRQERILIWVVLADPLQAPLLEPLDVGGIEDQPKAEDLCVVAVFQRP
jgi:hypothetical protein